jgi:hypothetical protein
MILKKICGYLILFLHEIIPFYIVYLLLFSENIIALNILLFMLIITLYQWYIFNKCMIYPIIDWFLDRNAKELEGVNKEDYYEFLFFGTNVKTLKLIIHSAHVYINFILILCGFIKLNYLYQKKIKNIKGKNMDSFSISKLRKKSRTGSRFIAKKIKKDN